MRFGIDLGTTRTIVAVADRGNYPVLSFTDPEGEVHEYLPSVVAREDGELRFGFDALAAAERGAPLLRSFKRHLGDPGTTPHTRIDIGGHEVELLDLLTGYLTHLREHLTVHEMVDDALEAVVSVPAHAHTTQRFLTLEAFRRAGFTVLALVNEPSAAGFEFTHRQPRSLSSRRTQVLVYDLGGGTFDASLVQADDERHEVLGSVGINRLGGDDFDAVLAETVLRTAGRDTAGLTRAQWRILLEECREAKERLSPQSRRMVIDLDGAPVVVAVDDFYAAAAPLVDASIEAMEPLVGRLEPAAISTTLASVAGMYLVGGGSGLPLVARSLRERFGRRVHRSPYPAAATAIGLAIAADPDSGVRLRDRLSRGFGVFRERDGGARVSFDEIFAADLVVSADADFSHTFKRVYRPAHNIGVFRFVEYHAVDERGEPVGELVPFAEVTFPFLPELQDGRELTPHDVRHLAQDEQRSEIEERYTVTADGRVGVEITDLGTGYHISRSPL